MQPICDPATATCTFDLTIQADVSATEVVADVTGFFRNVRREQVKSFVNTANVAFSLVDIDVTCANYGGTAVAVTAPVSERVVVEATAIVRVNHVNGTRSEVDAFIGTATGECLPDNYGHDAYTRFGSVLPTGETDVSIPVRRVVDVVAGSTTTFYLNLQTFGGTGHTIRHGGIDATFTPN